MTHHDYLPLIEDIACDADEALDLILTTPLMYDSEGMPVGYDATQLFGFEGPGRF
jgi:hypothetical protein